MPIRRAKHARPRHLVDGAGDVVEVGGHCGPFVDLATWEAPPTAGDWIATPAGSRYLVDHVHVVRRRKRTPHATRYQLRTLRIPKHTSPPDDVRVIWLSWYPRARS